MPAVVNCAYDPRLDLTLITLGQSSDSNDDHVKSEPDQHLTEADV